MNRIARRTATLVVATGIAAGLTLSGTAAHAEIPNGPGQIQLAPHTDPDGPQIGIPTQDPEPLPVPPKPKGPKPAPQVEGPDTIANPQQCTHGCGNDEAPDDLAAAPVKPAKPEPNADQPADSNTANQNPAEDAALDQGCFTGCDLPATDTGADTGANTGIVTPAQSDVEPEAAQTDSAFAPDSIEPNDAAGWSYYLGLGLFSIAGALGVALAAARLRRNRAVQA